MIITQILARNYRVYKHKTALIERTPAKNLRREITWNEFYKSSNNIANALIKKDIKKGDKVIQLMTNSLEWLPIYFGILTTGALGVPVVPEVKYKAALSSIFNFISGASSEHPLIKFS